MQLYNLGILAHVDAGKTTLTERLLFDAGAIAAFGSVDEGTTQTDSLAVERRRGITIKAAAASFRSGGDIVNLIDTPGHPDFIAEVERALRVLDGAILVVSAVEGVQPQTRLLMRALQRTSLPTVLFVNKIDRPGASCERTLASIAARLTPSVVAMGTVRDPGTSRASFAPWRGDDATARSLLLDALARVDDALLARFVEAGAVDAGDLRESLCAQVAAARVHPVYFGSAMTGAGVAPLLAGALELLPAARHDLDAPASGLVFRVEHSASGARFAHARMFEGTLHVREHVSCGGGAEHVVTAIDGYVAGRTERAGSLSAGEIGRVSGLGDVRVGDWIGADTQGRPPFRFPPPAFEAVVEPVRPEDGAALRDALRVLADEDPLIDVRHDARVGLSILLYGDVQREVIAETLRVEFGVEVRCLAATPVCLERPVGTGTAIALLRDPANPISATVGLRIDPAPSGSGVSFVLGIDPATVPIYIYKNKEAFIAAMTSHVEAALGSGLYGWEVTDCVVTLTACDYYVGDGRVPPGTTRTNAADFRRLTPTVVRGALTAAGTVVCEPLVRARIEVPTTRLRPALSLTARLGGAVDGPMTRGELATFEAELRAEDLATLRRGLSVATSGEGVIESALSGYRAVPGTPPVRTRAAHA